jgi:hypothetical protein
MKYLQSFDKTKNKLQEAILDFLRKIKKEGSETSEAAKILKRYASGEKVSKEDMDKFRQQIVDVVKILGIGLPFTLIPGSSILLPLVVKIAKKYNIDIFPSAFKD